MSWKYGAYLFLSSSWFTKRYWKISFYGKHPNQPVLHFPGGKQTRDGREGLNYLSAFPRRFNKWHHKRRPRSFFGEFAQKCKKICPKVWGWICLCYAGLPSPNPFFGSRRFVQCWILRLPTFPVKEKVFQFGVWKLRSFSFSSGTMQSLPDQIVHSLLPRFLTVTIFISEIFAQYFSNYCMTFSRDKRELRNVGL